jgi:hypothetical protein
MPHLIETVFIWHGRGHPPHLLGKLGQDFRHRLGSAAVARLTGITLIYLRRQPL